MKKAKLFLAAVTLIVFTVFPTTALCDTVDDICEQYDYYYRWSAEVVLDDSFNGTWLEGISDNGKVRITFIHPKNQMTYSAITSGGVLVFQGVKDVVLAHRKGLSSNEHSQVLKMGNTWDVASDGTIESYHEDLNHVYYAIYGQGEYRDEGRYMGIYLGASDERFLASTSVILLKNEDLVAAEDTEQILSERVRYYTEDKTWDDEIGLDSGRKSIEATPVIRENRKTPGIDDAMFKAEIQNEFEGLFDVTVDEIQSSVENKWVKNRNTDDFMYTVEVLNGRRMGRYYRSFKEGNMVFEIKVPQEFVSDISSDGNVVVKMQRYDRYYNLIPDKNTIFQRDPHSKYNTNIKIFTISGDLGKKQYCYNNLDRDTQEKNGIYFIESLLMPIHEMDENVVVAVYKENTGMLNPNLSGDRYIWDYPDEPWLYCEFDDENYSQLKEIGFNFDGKIYTKTLDEIKIDFGVECDFSDTVVEAIAAKGIVTNLRKARTVNNELSNILFDEMEKDFGTDVDDEKHSQDVNHEEENNNVEEQTDKDKIDILLQGKPLEFADQEPIIVNDRVLVPLRVIFEELGANVGWNGETQTVTMEKNGTVVSLKIGAAELIKDGTAVDLDVAAQIQNERTLVPIRAITESFGNTVTWDGNNKIVEIK